MREAKARNSMASAQRDLDHLRSLIRSIVSNVSICIHNVEPDQTAATCNQKY